MGRISINITSFSLFYFYFFVLAAKRKCIPKKIHKRIHTVQFVKMWHRARSHTETNTHWNMKIYRHWDNHRYGYGYFMVYALPVLVRYIEQKPYEKQKKHQQNCSPIIFTICSYIRQWIQYWYTPNYFSFIGKRRNKMKKKTNKIQ